jgi:hypothetical protein
MKHLTDIFMGLLVATVMLAFTTGAVMAQEKAKAEKSKAAPAEEKMKAEKAKKGEPTVKLLLENDRVKVQDVRFKPGDKSKMTERPDRVRYVIKGGEFKRYYPDGKTEGYGLKAGEAIFSKKDTVASENVGKTETQWIGINLK